MPRFLARVRCANTWLRVVFPDGMCIIIFCPYKSIAAAETNSVLGSGWQVSDMGSWDGFHVMLQNRGIQCSFNLPMMAMRFVAPLKVLGGKNSNEKKCSFFSIFSLTMSMSLCGLDSPLSPVCCAMILVISHCRWNHKHALRLQELILDQMFLLLKTSTIKGWPIPRLTLNQHLMGISINAQSTSWSILGQHLVNTQSMSESTLDQ